MSRKRHLKQLVRPVVLEIWADEQLDQTIVRTSSDESLSAGPIDAVDATNMVVLLLKNHVDLLRRGRA